MRDSTEKTYYEELELDAGRQIPAPWKEQETEEVDVSVMTFSDSIVHYMRQISKAMIIFDCILFAVLVILGVVAYLLSCPQAFMVGAAYCLLLWGTCEAGRDKSCNRKGELCALVSNDECTVLLLSFLLILCTLALLTFLYGICNG